MSHAHPEKPYCQLTPFTLPVLVIVHVTPWPPFSVPVGQVVDPAKAPQLYMPMPMSMPSVYLGSM